MRVLIALDESPVSTRAAREAVRLFAASDPEFLVINVSTVPAPWVGGAGFGVVAPLPPESRWLDEAEPATDVDVGVRAAEAGVPAAEPIAAVGDPVSVICAAADERDVDVIVVGAHDKSGLRRLVDPSVSAGVVRDTFRPVLVVSGSPPGEG